MSYEEEYLDLSAEEAPPQEETAETETQGEEATPDETPTETEAAEKDPEGSETEEEEHKRLSGSAKRKLQLERARAENELLRQQLAQIQASAPAQAMQKGEEPPNIDKFDSYAEYEEALKAYTVKQAREEAMQELQRQQYENLQAHLQQEWQQRSNELAKKIETNVKADPKLAEAVETYGELAQYASVRNPQMAQVLGEYILDSEVGDKLAIALGSDPDKAVSLLQMAPGKALRELARMEAGITSGKQEPKLKPQTQAPAPPKPVKAGGVNYQPKSLDSVMDIDY